MKLAAAIAPLVPGPESAAPVAAGRWPFAFGPRFFVLLLAGLLLLGPAWIDHRYVYAILVWNALVVLVWLADLLRLPAPGALQVTRRWLEPLSLGDPAHAELEIGSAGAGTVHVSVQDDVPAVLNSSLGNAAGREVAVGRDAPGRVSFTLCPEARGDFVAGGVYLRCQTRLRIAERRLFANLSTTLRVYPNLRASEQFTLYLMRSKQIELERRLKRKTGAGREFESLRDYREGDEPRDICWTASARRGKPITRTYRVERNQPVVVVVDAGRLLLARVRPISHAQPGSKFGMTSESGMRLESGTTSRFGVASESGRISKSGRSSESGMASEFGIRWESGIPKKSGSTTLDFAGQGSQPPRPGLADLGGENRGPTGGSESWNETSPPRVVLTKLDYVVNAALGLARVALDSGDSVGLTAYSRTFQARLGVARGPRHLRAVVESLAQVRGDLAEADHHRAAAHLLAVCKRRSLVVWLTDLAETAATPEVIEAASRLLQRHLVLFIALSQPELRELTAARPKTASDAYRYVAAQELVERRDLLLRRMRQQGALAFELEPGELAAGLVNRYLEIKERSLL